ncbi:MAG: hypothetical protein LH631_13400 [Alkalinema sp. CAN_BIN05]|nr:hypothetical protein [Alkalinema sp. CAN_BIN05]
MPQKVSSHLTIALLTSPVLFDHSVAREHGVLRPASQCSTTERPTHFAKGEAVAFSCGESDRHLFLVRQGREDL